MRGKRHFWAMILILGVCLFGISAWAHQTDSSLHVTEIRPATGEVEQLISISVEDLAHHMGFDTEGSFPPPHVLEAERQRIANYFEAHTPVSADGEDCDLRNEDFIGFPGQDGRIHYHQQWQCPRGASEVTLKNSILHGGHHGGYRHLARIQVGDDIFPTVFDPNFPTYTVHIGPGGSALAEEDAQAPADGEEESPLKFFLLENIVFVLVLLVALVIVINMGRRKRGPGKKEKAS